MLPTRRKRKTAHQSKVSILNTTQEWYSRDEIKLLNLKLKCLREVFNATCCTYLIFSVIHALRLYSCACIIHSSVNPNFHLIVLTDNPLLLPNPSLYTFPLILVSAHSPMFCNPHYTGSLCLVGAISTGPPLLANPDLLQPIPPMKFVGVGAPPPFIWWS